MHIESYLLFKEVVTPTKKIYNDLQHKASSPLGIYTVTLHCCVALYTVVLHLMIIRSWIPLSFKRCNTIFVLKISY